MHSHWCPGHCSLPIAIWATMVGWSIHAPMCVAYAAQHSSFSALRWAKVTKGTLAHGLGRQLPASPRQGIEHSSAKFSCYLLSMLGIVSLVNLKQFGKAVSISNFHSNLSWIIKLFLHELHVNSSLPFLQPTGLYCTCLNSSLNPPYADIIVNNFLFRRVTYERYDEGRVLAYQNRKPDKFYYVISGKLSLLMEYQLHTGTVTRVVGEQLKGQHSDVSYTDQSVCSWQNIFTHSAWEPVNIYIARNRLLSQSR